MDITQVKRLEFRRKFFKLFGASIDVKDAGNDTQVGYIQMKAFKLKEDIRLYDGPDKKLELMRIHARSVIDFGATYDVYAGNGQLFSLRRKGLRSTFVRDHWLILDNDGKEIGTVRETSSGLALLRRYTDLIPFVGWAVDLAMAFFPITYTIFDGEKAAGFVTHQRNPIIVKMSLDMSQSPENFDARVGIAATTLLSVMDANKN